MNKLVFFFLFGVTQLAFAAPGGDPCAMPPGLSEQVSTKYPGAHMVTVADLDQYDRELFQKDHDTLTLCS